MHSIHCRAPYNVPTQPRRPFRDLMRVTATWAGATRQGERKRRENRGGSRVASLRTQSPIFPSFAYLRRLSYRLGARALLFIPVTVFTGSAVRRGMHASLESFVASLRCHPAARSFVPRIRNGESYLLHRWIPIDVDDKTSFSALAFQRGE